MAIKNIVAFGIGFSPGSVKYIPTLGYSIGAETSSFSNLTQNWLSPTPHLIFLLALLRWLHDR